MSRSSNIQIGSIHVFAARFISAPAIVGEHFENHQLLLPDSPLYRVLLARSGGESIESQCQPDS